MRGLEELAECVDVPVHGQILLTALFVTPVGGHAEFGEVQDVFHLRDQAQSPRADHDAGCQVTDDGPQAQSLA